MKVPPSSTISGSYGRVTSTTCALMLWGFPELGNVPTSWSGNPFAAKERVVSSQVQVAVLVSLTDSSSLKMV